MANTKSAIKRIRISEDRRIRNNSYRARVRTIVKKAEQTVAKGNVDASALQAAVSMLDKAVSKGVLHKNNAARRKSRLMKKANAIAAK